VQLRTVGVVLAVVAGLVAYVVAAPASQAQGGTNQASSPSSVSRASTSARGVTAKAINVAFPVVSLTSLSGKLGFAEDLEYGEQTKAIKFFVKQVNDHGGIHGRRINPIITFFDPTDAAQMKADCANWTQGAPAVFAVVDGIGTWNGTNQLCVTRQGHTPLISQWTTVSDWTAQGAPYLWWTGPDDGAILQALVNWGLSSGRFGPGHKLAIIVGDRASDQVALHRYLLPDLENAGQSGTIVKQIAANPSEQATANADAPLIVQQLQAEKVTDVIPLVPFNAFTPILQAESTQHYYPSLMLSDYENSILSGLGLVPEFVGALDGQEGLTTETLGGIDDNRPESQGGYDPGVRACYDAWIKAYPKPVPGALAAYIEEQGPIQAWCTAIHLFATAATMAGPNLNRRTFVEAMSRIKNFPGGFTPVLSYGPHKFYGPVQYQIVKLHNNVPPTALCKLPSFHKAQGTCWVTVNGWAPLPPA
jgi:hypothetical protein